MVDQAQRRAVLYRMVMPDHICLYGLKAKDLLKREGFEVEDHHLKTREETDAFKVEHGVKTTPQTLINGERIGGYDDLRRHFGKRVAEPGATSYRPVIAVFAMTAAMALAASYAVSGQFLTVRAAEWFIAFSMCVLALFKLQNIEKFSTMFLNYDLLARRWMPYGHIYPFAEGLAGILMVAGALNWLSIPVALTIGTIGAASVFKAVYIEKRELKCACVGGDVDRPGSDDGENMVLKAGNPVRMTPVFPAFFQCFIAVARRRLEGGDGFAQPRRAATGSTPART